MIMSPATDLDYFRSRLRIDRHRLDEELEIHADHSDRIAQGVKKATQAEAQARREFERKEAELMRDMITDDPKMSQARATAEVKLRRDWGVAWAAYQEAKGPLMDWEGLQKAWYQKGFDLKALGDLYAHQYWSPDSIKGPGDQTKVRQEQRAATGSYFAEREARNAGRRARLDDDEPQRPRRRSQLDG